MMDVDYASSMQAAHAAVLLYWGPVAAKAASDEWAWMFPERRTLPLEWLGSRLGTVMVETSITEGVHGVQQAVYDRAKRTGNPSFGLWEPGNAPGSVVWGLMYAKPCRCDGLMLFLGDRDRPHMGVPHCNRYLGTAVLLVKPVAVRWPELRGLPILS